MTWLWFRFVAWVNRHDPEAAYYLLTGDPRGLPGWSRLSRCRSTKSEGDE